jgi:hypothetical protein
MSTASLSASTLRIDAIVGLVYFHSSSGVALPAGQSSGSFSLEPMKSP